MRLYSTIIPVGPDSTPTSPIMPPPATPRDNALVRFARHLIETGARARTRRHLKDVPDHLRADAGLPPRWNDE